MVPAGALKMLNMPQRQVLRGVHNGGLPMNEAHYVHALRELARLNGEVRNAQSFERKPRKQRAVKHKCWIRGCSSHVTAKCPNQPSAMGKRQDETTRRLSDAGAHMRALAAPETFGGSFAGVEQVETHHPVRVGATRVEQALGMMEPLFSGSGEVIMFQLPVSLRPDSEE